MPFKPVEHPKCPVCGKNVYAAEEMVSGGHKYHKCCFKCGLCSQMLDSTKVSEHGTDLYCKKCHARKFGIKGVGFGLGAGCLTTDHGERFGNTVTEDQRPQTGQAYLVNRTVGKTLQQEQQPAE